MRPRRPTVARSVQGTGRRTGHGPVLPRDPPGTHRAVRSYWLVGHLQSSHCGRWPSLLYSVSMSSHGSIGSCSSFRVNVGGTVVLALIRRPSIPCLTGAALAEAWSTAAAASLTLCCDGMVGSWVKWRCFLNRTIGPHHGTFGVDAFIILNSTVCHDSRRLGVNI